MARLRIGLEESDHVRREWRRLNQLLGLPMTTRVYILSGPDINSQSVSYSSMRASVFYPLCRIPHFSILVCLPCYYVRRKYPLQHIQNEFHSFIRTTAGIGSKREAKRGHQQAPKIQIKGIGCLRDLQRAEDEVRHFVGDDWMHPMPESWFCMCHKAR